jgi:hypothetical protein
MGKVYFSSGGVMSYLCKCGRTVKVAASDQIRGGFDYCGCGRMEIILDRHQVNADRKLAKLPELDE